MFTGEKNEKGTGDLQRHLNRQTSQISFAFPSLGPPSLITADENHLIWKRSGLEDGHLIVTLSLLCPEQLPMLSGQAGAQKGGSPGLFLPPGPPVPTL